jgi:hypothetical protein
MTQPAERDGRLFYLLALYAALDQAVLGDPNIAGIVEGYLPGTTGENNQRGWSVNLEQSFHFEFPDVNAALTGLLGIQNLTPSQLSRLVYVLGSLMHLPEGRVGIANAQIVQGLGLARPTQAPGTEPTRTPTPAEGVAYATGEPQDPGTELFKVLMEHFNSQGDWYLAITEAERKNCVDALVARIPPCNACVTQQGDIECVVVDTNFDDPSLTVDRVEAILDPRNWSKTSDLFFCDMTGLPKRQQPPYKDWGVVLEKVSAWCGTIPLQLKTELKYFKAQYSDGAVVQYDLNEKPPAKGQGDGLATVDKGWLRVVKGTNANRNAGVTVTTRKVVHIDPLWPVAQKIFVCVMGYGEAARDMLIRGAAQPPTGLVAWSADPAPSVYTQSMHAFFTAPATGTQAVQPPPAQPAGAQAAQAGAGSTASGSGASPQTAAGLAVSMLSDYLAETANDSAAFAAKFADKDLTVDELVKFSAKMGARMASEPWRFLQRLSELPPPKPPITGDKGF